MGMAEGKPWYKGYYSAKIFKGKGDTVFLLRKKLCIFLLGSFSGASYLFHFMVQDVH